MRKVYRLSGGMPRLINIICDRALLGAYALDKQRVGAAIVRRPVGKRRDHSMVQAASSGVDRWIVAFAR